MKQLKSTAPQGPDDPASWAPSHWLKVNVWYREAKPLFEPAEGKPGQSAEDRPRQAPEAKKTEPSQERGQKPEARSGNETQAEEQSKNSPQPSEETVKGQPAP